MASLFPLSGDAFLPDASLECLILLWCELLVTKVISIAWIAICHYYGTIFLTTYMNSYMLTPNAYSDVTIQEMCFIHFYFSYIYLQTFDIALIATCFALICIFSPQVSYLKIQIQYCSMLFYDSFCLS